MKGYGIEAAQDFGAACSIAARAYRREADALQRECEAAGVEGNPQFWLDAADDALKAEAIYRAVRQAAHNRAIRLLKEESLHAFADALESGDFVRHLGF